MTALPDESSETDASDRPDDPPEIREDVMEATYRALCECGYAGLTMQAIADEYDKSKSLILYHYDSKADLLTAFLAYLLERFKSKVEEPGDAAPAERLDRLLDAFLCAEKGDRDFQTAMLELRSQVPYEPAYREQFRAHDAFLRDLLAAVVEAGIESGQFREDADPERVVALLQSAVDGARTRAITVGDDGPLRETRAALDAYLQSDLYRVDAAATAEGDA